MWICAVLPQVACERCPDMEEQAQAVAHEYGRALLLFSKYHNAYNSSQYFDNSALSTLRKTIIHIHYAFLSLPYSVWHRSISGILQGHDEQLVFPVAAHARGTCSSIH